jgi:diguanylate cyclase (GGDEF)-like protein
VDVEIFGVPVIVGGDQIGILGLYQDVSARIESEQQLQFLATHDLLTELPNRFLFNDRLQHALTKAKRYHSSFAALFLDLDGFKEVNDSFGHQKGDLVLQQVAKRLKSCVRESDTLARLGGDEFSYILEDIQDEQTAFGISHKILTMLAEPFLVDGKEALVTASIGISLYPEDGDDTEALLKKADSAMYKAKEAGGNTCTCYGQIYSDREGKRGQPWIG